MTHHPIPAELALETRRMFEVTFSNLRRAENTFAQYQSPQSRAILDALARAERELGLADAHLRHIIPDQALFAPPKTFWEGLRTLLKGEK